MIEKNRIKRILKMQKRTLESLHREIAVKHPHVSYVTCSRWIRNVRQPKPEIRDTIAWALGLPEDYVFYTIKQRG